MLTAINSDTGERVNIEPVKHGDALPDGSRVWVETYRNGAGWDCFYKPGRVLKVDGDRARVSLDGNKLPAWKPLAAVFVAVAS